MREPTVPYVVYGFGSTHDALVGERTLLEADVTTVTIPTPKGIGGLCGISLRVPWLEGADADVALLRAGCRWTARIEMLDF
ncbi:MAG: hypothetical protein FD171_1852 [Actinobacteria bacterium]|nr:MAG: hypothetical protein FD171_1852 [Actinomycetota bacterium]